jgi:hypothetical protein
MITVIIFNVNAFDNYYHLVHQGRITGEALTTVI